METPHSERRDPGHWRSHRDTWWNRTIALVAGVALGFALLAWLDARRIVPDDLALGVENWAATAEYDGRRINAWKLYEYSQVYRPSADARRDILWLGNSQLHAINQLKRGRDQVAAFHSSQALATTVYCLSLPNANVQEQLVTFEWALTRRKVGWLVLPMVFDKLRNDGLRSGFEHLSSPGLSAQLAKRPSGARLAVELAEHDRTARETRSEGAKPLSQHSWSEILHGVSLQDASERELDALLSTRWQLWAKRPELWATFLNDLYNLRNWAFGLKSTTKRPMLPVPFEKNMAAFEEILDRAEASNVNVLVYIAPIRQDVEPPYIMAEYLPWKDKVARLIELRKKSASIQLQYVDLDKLVPAELWGTVENSKEIDFMHFQGPAHEILGAKVAALLKEYGPNSTMGRTLTNTPAVLKSEAGNGRQ